MPTLDFGAEQQLIFELRPARDPDKTYGFAHAVISLKDLSSSVWTAFVSRCAMFFLATADAHGRPDVSYRGGMPGFVRIVDDRTLAFPDYDGNGMFKSLGNILANPNVGLLSVDFEHPDRMRVGGTRRSLPTTRCSANSPVLN